MILTDKDIMADLLKDTKALSGAYHMAVLESANDRIRNTLIQINNEELELQKRIFDLMHDRGYYQVEPARTTGTQDYIYRPMQQQMMQQGQQQPQYQQQPQPQPQPQIRY